MKKATLRTALNPSYILTFLICTSLLLFAVGCKKDQLVVNVEKVYLQVDHVPSNPYDGGWMLTLQPDGSADVLPGGDIRYRGTYKINGSSIKVKTDHNEGTYNFTINSETEIKENTYGTILRLQ